MKRAAIVIAWLALISVTSAARADAITMPPSCPESSEDAFCHGPPTCRPRLCITSTTCNAGEVCRARALCAEVHTCFGLGMSTATAHVFGDCDASGACPIGGDCGSYLVCAPATVGADAAAAMDAGGTDAGVVPEHVTACGCRMGSREGHAAAIVLVLAALGVFVGRRATR